MGPLSDFIIKHTNLKELSLWLPCNYITDEGAIRLLECLQNLSELTHLVINLEWLFKKEL